MPQRGPGGVSHESSSVNGWVGTSESSNGLFLGALSERQTILLVLSWMLE